MNEAGADTAFDQANMQLDFIGLARRVGQGKGAGAVDAGQRQVDVLPGLEGHRPVQFDMQTLDRRREIDQGGDRATVVFHRVAEEIRVGLDIGLDHHVGLRQGATGQNLALVALDVHQGERRGRADIHFAFEHLHLAGGAGAVATGERQPYALAQRGLQDGLAFLYFDHFAGGFDGDVVCHGTPLSCTNPGRHSTLGYSGAACFYGRYRWPPGWRRNPVRSARR